MVQGLGVRLPLKTFQSDVRNYDILYNGPDVNIDFLKGNANLVSSWWHIKLFDDIDTDDYDYFQIGVYSSFGYGIGFCPASNIPKRTNSDVSNSNTSGEEIQWGGATISGFRIGKKDMYFYKSSGTNTTADPVIYAIWGVKTPQDRRRED